MITYTPTEKQPKESQNPDIIGNIYRLMEEKNVTMYRLSKGTGISQSTLANMKARGHYPSVFTLIKIAEYFHVSVDYLVYGKTQFEKPHEPGDLTLALTRLNEDLYQDIGSSSYTYHGHSIDTADMKLLRYALDLIEKDSQS